MGNQQHTPEPWRVRTIGDDCFITAATEPGMAYGPEIMGDDYTGYGDAERKKADARRIVACVNACAGISTENLEALVGTSILARANRHFDTAIKQRDELLDALEEASTSLETISRIAGKAFYVGDDGDLVPTFMEHHDQVRGYATSRSAVARSAIASVKVGEV